MALAGLVHGSGRRLYVSGAAEATFGAGATLTHVLEHFCESNHLDVTNDIQEYTHGLNTDLLSREIPVGTSMAGEVVIPASELAIPLFLHKAIGLETKAGSTGAYTHVSAMDITPQWLPSMAIENHLIAAAHNDSYDYLHWGVNVDRFKLSVTPTGVAQITVGLMGAGVTSPPADITEAGMVKPTSFITKGMCRVIMAPCATPGTTAWDGSSEVGTTVGTWGTIDPGAGTVNISEYIESFEFEVANNATAGRECGFGAATGLTMGPAFPRNRRVTLTLKVKQGTPLIAWWKARSTATWAAPLEYMFSIAISSTTANNGIMVTLPLCSLSSNPVASGVGLLVPSYTWDAKATYTGTSYGAITSYAVNTDNIDYA